MPGHFTKTARIAQARFPKIGSVVDGTVLSVELAPVPEIENGKVVGTKIDPLTGEQLNQTDVLLDANGIQTVVHTRGGAEFAIAAELERIGADDLHVGDYLSLTYVADEEIAEGLTPAKVFEAKIVQAGAK